MSSNDRDRPTPTETSRPTLVPAVAPEALAQSPEARRTPSPMPAVREAQATITNEAELERARVASMQLGTPIQQSSDAVVDDAASVMRDKFELGDFAGALEIAERILAASPSHEAASRIAEESRATLAELYEGRLGSLDRVPVVVMARDELRWLSLDHRGGFLLSHIDGVSSLETILDVSGMPRLDAMRILVELVQKRVVAFR